MLKPNQPSKETIKVLLNLIKSTSLPLLLEKEKQLIQLKKAKNYVRNYEKETAGG